MLAMTPFVLAAGTAERGISIAVAGMLIVAFALTFISLFIASMPRILDFVGKYWPEEEDLHDAGTHAAISDAEDEAILAAIGFVLHTEFQNQILAEQAAGNKG